MTPTFETGEEFCRRELVAFDLYAKRRGYMGVKDPVRWKDLAPRERDRERERERAKPLCYELNLHATR